MVQVLPPFQPEWSVPPWQEQSSRNDLVPLEKELLLCEEDRDEDTAKLLLSLCRDESFDSFLRLSETFIRGD